MSKQTVQEMYAAFGRGDIHTILSHLADDVSWEAEGPASLSFTGVGKGHTAALRFFEALAAHHQDPNLEMTDILESGDTVAAFGRYQATVRGARLDSPSPTCGNSGTAR